jgi:hypothetical protein
MNLEFTSKTEALPDINIIDTESNRTIGWFMAGKEDEYAFCPISVYYYTLDELTIIRDKLKEITTNEPADN